MLLLLTALLLPPQVLADDRLRSCSSSQSFTVSSPHLRVDAITVEDALTLDIALISAEGTSGSLSATALHAFVRVDDDRAVLVNLPPGGHISLTYPGLAPGIHRVRSGVYSGTKVWSAAITCPNI
jgi:hypothetical protein